MASSASASLEMNWQEQVRKFFNEGKYSDAASFYEQAIATELSVKSYYWYLGLAYLLQGYEEEAQVTWMSAMVEGTFEEVEEWTQELVQILEAEAQHQADVDNHKNCWLIRHHIKEIAPTHIHNILHLIQTLVELDEFIPELLTQWQLVTILQQSSPEQVDPALLLQVIQQIIVFPAPEILEFIEACLPYQSQNPQLFIKTLLTIVIKLAYKDGLAHFAIYLTELCLKLKPESLELLQHLSGFYSRAGLHQQAIETAKRFFEHCLDTSMQAHGSYLMLRALLNAGSGLEAKLAAQQHKNIVRKVVQNPPENIEPYLASYLLIANFFLPYLQDQPQENRWLQNQLGQLFQKTFQAAQPALVNSTWNNSREKTRRLKIGYIAHTLKNHSVGWLSRWLFRHSDRESFQTNLYLVLQKPEDHLWFTKQVDFAYNFDTNIEAIVTKIREDEIDILVDLDSLTLDITCQVMALKPAPVQVTWLGWDAAGVPAIDYYIADPYVLPENAQEYYSETIWRLPHSYVAVDGFEVDVPTLRRDHLNIPIDATIYFSSQVGLKRHPDTVRLQMQILKQVPNSYFLVKGMADEKTIQQFFTQVAESEGVNPNRLRFLPIDPNESTHRANLGCADVVLDTYPYNGATTTLETLWMGVPLVTKVGQQFSARNSYTFMMNVGVTEGIAWTDEEYVEWGVKLGRDPMLRQQISWKLRQSRQTSPLWNAQQFTREMEKAYKQMWQRYVEG